MRTARTQLTKAPLLLGLLLAFLLTAELTSAIRTGSTGGHTLHPQSNNHRPWGVSKHSCRSDGQQTCNDEDDDDTEQQQQRLDPVPIVRDQEEYSDKQNDILFAVDNYKSRGKYKMNPPSPPKIIIMGGPASGKGTQCEHIVARHNVVHLSTGDMLRHVVKNSPGGLGAVVKEYMESGKLVPDDIMIQIVVERINQRDCQEHGFLLDGFPRTAAQAQALADRGIQPDVFLFLDVADEELIRRVTGRRMDPDTGKIYHLEFSPPPPDVDVNKLIQRSDDTVDKLELRLEAFHSNVRAVQACYSDVQVNIDGSGSPREVSERVMSTLEEQLASRAIATARP